MIVIKVRFENFDPNEDEWAIIWFSEFSNSPEDIPYTLRSMAKTSKENDDLIEYLKKESVKKKWLVMQK
jgi:hypothetical protein